MGSAKASPTEIDTTALQETMRRGVQGLAQARLRFTRLERLQEGFDIDTVAETRKLFGKADESSLKDALNRVTPGRQVTRAAYAGLLLSGRDRFLSEMITGWDNRDDVRAFIGAPVTLRAVDTRGIEPDMSFDETTVELSSGSRISGTITGLSIVEGGAVMLKEGDYAIDNDLADESGNFEEGSVTGMFQVDTDVAQARFSIEPGLAR